MPEASKPQELEALRRLVREHQAVFEVYPAFDYTQGPRRQIGFDLILYGTHGPTRHPPRPGCEECLPVWRDLGRIARAAFPASNHKTGFEILPFDQLLHESKVRRFRTDVELSVAIRHKEEFLDLLDACESRCLDEMLAGLKRLGVQESAWEEYRARWFGSEDNKQSPQVRGENDESQQT